MVNVRLPWEVTSSAREVTSSAQAVQPLASPLIPPPVVDGNDAFWIKERMTKDFWVNTAVRAARTFVQTVIALNTSNTLWDFGMPWIDLVYTSLGAAGLSVLMSIDRSVKN